MSLPVSREEIIEGIRRWDTPEGWEVIRDWKWEKFGEQVIAVREGREIVDQDGVPL